MTRQSAVRWGHYGLIIGVATVMMLWQLGLRPLDSHESYVGITVQAMAQPDQWLDPLLTSPVPPNTPLNHWMVPVFNGSPRLVKTPLAYWCVTGLVKAGLPISEFTTRLPSAIAAILLAVVTLALGRRMFSPRAALLGTLVLVTSFGVQAWGRNGRPEMLLCLWTTLAMACFYTGVNTSPPGRRHAWLLAGWVAMGLGNLSKEFVPLLLGLPILIWLGWRSSQEPAPAGATTDSAAPGPDRPQRWFVIYLIATGIGVVVYDLVQKLPFLDWWTPLHLAQKYGAAGTLAATVGIPLGWYLLRCRAWREGKRMLLSGIPGIAIMLLMFVPWLLYMAHLFPQAGGVFSQQVTDRAAGAEKWFDGKLPGFYVMYLVMLTLPWVIFLPGALAIPFSRRFREDREKLVFLLTWIFGLIVLFSVAAGKRGHYILPAVPAAGLLLGYCLEDVFFRHRWFSLKTAQRIVNVYAVVGVLAIVGAGIAAIVLPSALRPRGLHVLAMGVAVAVPMALAALLLRSRPAWALGLTLSAVMLCFLTFSSRADLWDNEPELYDVACQAVVLVPPDAPIIAWSGVPAEIRFYVGRDIRDAQSYIARHYRQFGRAQGLVEWRKWRQQQVTDTPGVWVLGKVQDIPELQGLGFVPRTILPREGKTTSGRYPVMFSRETTTTTTSAP